MKYTRIWSEVAAIGVTGRVRTLKDRRNFCRFRPVVYRVSVFQLTVCANSTRPSWRASAHKPRGKVI